MDNDTNDTKKDNKDGYWYFSLPNGDTIFGPTKEAVMKFYEKNKHLFEIPYK